MFIRAVWRRKHLVDIRPALRELKLHAARDADLLGLGGRDFPKMACSLFDRRLLS